jgi:hypothetical protein
VGEALIGSWHSKGTAGIFSESTLAALQRPSPALPEQIASGARSEQMPESFGVSFGHYSNNVLGHNGSMFGQTCTLRVDLSRKVAIAVGVNAWVPYARDSTVNRTLAFITGARARSGESSSSPDLDKISFKLEKLINQFSTQDIAGRYVGSYFGEVHVSCHDGCIHFDLGREGSKRTRISAVPDSHGDYAIDSPVPVLVGFFSAPDGSGKPALVMGAYSYKKDS